MVDSILTSSVAPINEGITKPLAYFYFLSRDATPEVPLHQNIVQPKTITPQLSELYIHSDFMIGVQFLNGLSFLPSQIKDPHHHQSQPLTIANLLR